MWPNLCSAKYLTYIFQGKCIGKEIDDDGDIINSKGQTLGHVSLLEDIPPEPEAEPEPEPEVEEEDPEEVEKRKQLEVDRKLAGQMAMCLTQSLDKIKPILRMITDVSTPNFHTRTLAD